MRSDHDGFLTKRMHRLWRYRRSVWTVAVVVFGYMGVSILAGLVRGTPLPPPARLPGRYTHKFSQLLDRDGILPIYSPQFVLASQSDLAPDELVIGVQIQGEARAYPIGYLNLREMVDDRIGPVPFLVTW